MQKDLFLTNLYCLFVKYVKTLGLRLRKCLAKVLSNVAVYFFHQPLGS